MPRTTTSSTGTATVGATANGMTVGNGESAPTPEAGKGTSRPVNPGIRPTMFRKIGANLPTEITTRKGGGGGVGRTLGESTLGALRFIRENAGEWCAIGEYAKPSPPPPRLSFAGFFVDEDGNPVAPSEDEEKTTPPDGFPIKKKIAYKYGRIDADGNYDPNAQFETLFLKLTEEDWKPPKKREPKPEAAEAPQDEEVQESERVG